jgi:hypothetical protein
MRAHIRLLEDRVREAVERIRALGAERDRLHEEVRSLRSRLAQLEDEAARSRPVDGGNGGGPEWRSEVAGVLRDVITELRAE